MKFIQGVLTIVVVIYTVRALDELIIDLNKTRDEKKAALAVNS